MTAPANASPVARLLDALRQAECAGLGWADLYAGASAGPEETIHAMHVALQHDLAARRAFEVANGAAASAAPAGSSTQGSTAAAGEPPAGPEPHGARRGG